MKRIFAWLLLGAILVGLCGCAMAVEENPDTEESADTETTENTMETTIRATEVRSEEKLFLKVSTITFSLVGESEDIYLGMAPREQVIWESEDPSVISVENGVLTAKGVGTTKISASYGDSRAECTASCLARNVEELESLSMDILRKPKRVIPDVDLNTPCTFYDNAVLIGDSISYMLIQCENKGDYLGKLQFLARGGTSMIGFARRFKNIFYQGTEMNLEDAVAETKAERAYIFIGSNDIADENNRLTFFDNWDIILQRLREKTPDLEIVVISNIPQCTGVESVRKEQQHYYNLLIDEYNEKLKLYCKKNDMLYLDLSSYVQDHCGNLATEYNLDGYHFNDSGYMNWIKVMRYYAQYEIEGGTLS